MTISFRDPDYSADDDGYHPVEIRLENNGDSWRFSYTTNSCYVGNGYCAELAKDLDFDAEIFQNLHITKLYMYSRLKTFLLIKQNSWLTLFIKSNI